MRSLRTISTRRLLAICAAVVVLGAGGAAIALAAGGGPVPPPRPLDQAVRAALAAPPVQGVSARIAFANRLIDSTSVQRSDPVLSGATGRLWAGAGGRFRLELQSDGGDAQVVSDGRTVSIYDATMRFAYQLAMPADTGAAGAHAGGRHRAAPPRAQIDRALARLGRHAIVSGASPGDVGGRPAYTVRVAPRRDGGLFGAAELAWDAVRGVPLRVAIYARGDDQPVLELKATDVSYGPVPASVFEVSPPAGVQVTKIDLGGDAAKSGAKGSRPAAVTGLAAVGAALPFRLSAPATLAGMPRGEVRLVGRDAALVTYGRGLGGLAVLEQPARQTGALPTAAKARGHRDRQPGLALPTVAIGGATAQELPTALGTLLRLTRGGVAYTIVGSVEPSLAEAAARGL